MKREHWILIILVVLTVVIRLSYALTMPQMVPEDYYPLRVIQELHETGSVASYDVLSYGGREQIQLPGFPYLVVGIASLFFQYPSAYFLEIVLNVFAASLVVIVYLLSLEFSKSKRAALFAAAMTLVIPVWFEQTANAISLMAVFVPLLFFALYCFMRGDRLPYGICFVLLSVVLPLFHPSALLLVAALYGYVLFSKSQDFAVSRKQYELIMFATFTQFWILLVYYKTPLLEHGLASIWGNLPSDVALVYFTPLTIIQAVHGIGFFLLLIGAYVIYDGVVRGGQNFFLLLAFALATISAGWLQLISLDITLIILAGTMLVFLSKGLTTLYELSMKTRIAHLASWLIGAIVVLLVFASAVGTITFLQDPSFLSEADAEAMQWLRMNTPTEAGIAAPLALGHPLTYLAQRRSFVDENFLLAPTVEERLEDLHEIYVTFSTVRAIGLLAENDLQYVYVPTGTSFTSGDEDCFSLQYNKGVRIYQLICRPTVEHIR